MEFRFILKKILQKSIGEVNITAADVKINWKLKNMFSIFNAPANILL